MTTMITEVYDALIDAGAKKELASKAAEAIAAHQTDIASIKGELTLIRWMLTVNTAFVLGVFWKVFL